MKQVNAQDSSGNQLYALAQLLAANGRHSTSTALRKLAQAGYTSLEEVDRAPDSVLLAIRGIGPSRLRAVRALTRSHWQSPSPQAAQAANRFLFAVRYALRFWPARVLRRRIESCQFTVSDACSPESRLALDLFAKAADEALRHHGTEELLLSLRQVEHSQARQPWPKPQPIHDADAMVSEARHEGAPPSSLKHVNSRNGDAPKETDHYAYPRDERLEIVNKYRLARQKGQVGNKDQWARANCNISGKTLLSYEREFPEVGIET